jgi:hypothetical protein
MNLNKKPTPNFQESRGGDRASRPSFSDPGLCVTVIATTDEGTTAALNAAGWLAKDLNARITLLKMEVVPARLPLYRPPVSLNFTIKRQHSLVLRSGVTEEDVDIRIRLCRGHEAGLQRLLRRRALVVIGGRRHWWLSSQERLEKMLRRLGHHVIFVDVGQKTDWTSHSSFPIDPGSGTGQFQEQAVATESTFGREDLQ